MVIPVLVEPEVRSPRTGLESSQRRCHSKLCRSTVLMLGPAVHRSGATMINTNTTMAPMMPTPTRTGNGVRPTAATPRPWAPLLCGSAALSGLGAREGSGSISAPTWGALRGGEARSPAGAPPAPRVRSGCRVAVHQYRHQPAGRCGLPRPTKVWPGIIGVAGLTAQRAPGYL